MPAAYHRLTASDVGLGSIACHGSRHYFACWPWSGYYYPTNRDGTRPLDVGSRDANDQADVRTYIFGLKHMVDEHRPLRIAFYVGEQDTAFLHYNEELHSELLAARVPHVYATYPGGHGRRVLGRERTGLGHRRRRRDDADALNPPILTGR